MRGKPVTMPIPGHAANFEDVREISTKVERQRDLDRVGAIVVDHEPLMAGGVPQADGSEHMDRAALNQPAVAEADVRIHEVHRERGIVVPDRGTEQQWAAIGEAQPESRQVAGVAVIDAVDAECAGPGSLNVAEPVENGEGIAVLEYAGPVVDAGRSRENVVAVGYSEHFVRVDHADSLNRRALASLS